MRRAFLALVLASGVLGCKGEPKERPSEPRAVAEPLDALSRRLGRVRQRMRERGYEETGWSLRLFLPAELGRAETVRIRRGVCTTFLALSGGSVQELELALYDADGRRAAVDSVRGEGSLVHACPRPPARGGSRDALYYLKARATGGGGAVAIRAFESALGSAAGVEGVFEGILAPRDRGDGAATRLGRSVDRLRTRGMIPSGEKGLARVLEGEALRRPTELEAGHCYVAIARGEDAVQDVSLYLLDPAGAEVARDLEGRDEPRLEHCAERTGTYVLEARAAEGSGDVGVAILLDPNASPVAEAVVAAPVGPAPGPPGPGAVPRAVAALIERGYASPRYLVRGAALRPGETVAHDLTLAEGCSVLLAAPESSEMDLDLYVSDLEGEPIASDTRITAEARLATCRERSRPVRATVKAYGREGTYALVVLDAPEGASDVARVRLLEAVAPFVARGYQQGTIEELQVVEGEERLFRYEIPGGTCFLAAIAGGQSVEDIDLALRAQGDGRVLASDTGPDAWASVSRCTEETESLELRVVAYRGTGRALLQSMRRPR